MRVFALSDPHLALDTPNKAMDRFGDSWKDHANTMATAWDAMVTDDDLVIVPGDVSWARDLTSVAADLDWLAARPGTVVLGKGNHEHWWASKGKVRAALPEGMYAVDGDAIRVGDVALAGTRLWDGPGIDWHDQILWQGEPISREPSEAEQAHIAKIWTRQVTRLRRALDDLDESAPIRIAMVHYPPSGPGMSPQNDATDAIEAAGVSHCVFGHLHSLDPAQADLVGGDVRGVKYVCASVDFIGFRPVLIGEW